MMLDNKIFRRRWIAGVIRAFAIVTVLFAVPAAVMAQVPRISVYGIDVPLYELLNQIEAQSGYTFAYNKSALDLSKHVTLQASNTCIEDVLKHILNDTGHTYILSYMHIMVLPVKEAESMKSEHTVPHAVDPVAVSRPAIVETWPSLPVSQPNTVASSRLATVLQSAMLSRPAADVASQPAAAPSSATPVSHPASVVPGSIARIPAVQVSRPASIVSGSGNYRRDETTVSPSTPSTATTSHGSTTVAEPSPGSVGSVPMTGQTHFGSQSAIKWLHRQEQQTAIPAEREISTVTTTQIPDQIVVDRIPASVRQVEVSRQTPGRTIVSDTRPQSSITPTIPAQPAAATSSQQSMPPQQSQTVRLSPRTQQQQQQQSVELPRTQPQPAQKSTRQPVTTQVDPQLTPQEITPLSPEESTTSFPMQKTLGAPSIPQSPLLAVKTNLLFDVTTTMNFGLELKIAPKWTVELTGSYNPWTWAGNRKFKSVIVQPEFRYWLCDPFSGHFLGAHAHWAHYNFGNLPFGALKNHRYQGDLVGAGISYGYSWYLGRRWALEGTIGVGYAYMDYQTFEGIECGTCFGWNNTHYLGITKLGLSLSFLIK